MDKREVEETFWDRLTARMIEKYPGTKVTQKTVAQLIGKSQNTGFKWQHGILPERKHLTELAEKLGVALEWLETGRGPKFVPDPQDPVSIEIFRIVVDADELQRMEFLNFLQYTADKNDARKGNNVRYFPKNRPR